MSSHHRCSSSGCGVRARHPGRGFQHLASGEGSSHAAAQCGAACLPPNLLAGRLVECRCPQSPPALHEVCCARDSLAGEDLVSVLHNRPQSFMTDPGFVTNHHHLTCQGDDTLQNQKNGNMNHISYVQDCLGINCHKFATYLTHIDRTNDLVTCRDPILYRDPYSTGRGVIVQHWLV